MNAIVLKTRIKNTSGQGMLFRWIAPRGQYLEKDAEVVVDGAYPTAVLEVNRRFVSSCEYDIHNGRVDIELVTNLSTSTPSKKVVEEAVTPQKIPAPIPPAEAPKVELKDQEDAKGVLDKPNERWQQGTIEGSKPEPMTLPGHEETLETAAATQNPDAKNADGPQTLEIFKEGTDLGEQKRAEDEAAQAAAAEAAKAKAEAEAPAAETKADAPVAETEKPETKKPAKKRRKSRKAAKTTE